MATKKAVKKAASKPARKPIQVGAGRPVGTGKYGVPTKVMRIPTYLEDEIAAFCKKRIEKDKRS
jgi:hypothetical protein